MSTFYESMNTQYNMFRKNNILKAYSLPIILQTKRIKSSELKQKKDKIVLNKVYYKVANIDIICRDCYHEM